MIIDLLIILVAIAAVYAGRHSGLLRRFWAIAGFFVGLLLGRWLEPTFLRLVDTAADRAVMTMVVLLVCAFIGLAVGEFIGTHIKKRLLDKKLNQVDNVLGGVLSVLSILIGFWLLAALAVNLPYQSFNRSLQASRIIGGLNRLLPPAPQLIASLGHLIDPNGFPDVFISNERIPRDKVDLPGLSEFNAAVNSTKDSVVRLTGQGCGGLVYGSGFVVGENLVATNAHVIAGINRPYIQDINGTRQATVIRFNPQLDVAILRVNNLGGQPLSFSDKLATNNSPAVIVGYPGGGKFTASPAVIFDSFRARGRDIYGKELVTRNVYEVQADVSQGNSGGPLINQAGKVLGMVFAESTSHEHVAYVLTHDQLVNELEQAAGRTQAVGTGRCSV